MPSLICLEISDQNESKVSAAGHLAGASNVRAGAFLLSTSPEQHPIVRPEPNVGLRLHQDEDVRMQRTSPRED
jgi:hypothetical protein